MQPHPTPYNKTLKNMTFYLGIQNLYNGHIYLACFVKEEIINLANK